MLRQLFLILIENAIKYSPSETTICVDMKEIGGKPTVTVADEGIGIAEEHLPHIFERFYRAAPQPSEGTRSGGLGLAIAAAIADAHHGSIQCEGTKGAGSRFTVTFELLHFESALRLWKMRTLSARGAAAKGLGVNTAQPSRPLLAVANDRLSG